MTEFKKDEKEKLLKHVTNVDKDVYCVKNLPEEVVSVLFAYVSRSPLSFRENLLKLLGSGDILVGTGDVYQDTGYEQAKKKAQKFHDKWVVGYGHSSVAEHADIKFAVDKLSIVATKIIEDNRLGRFTEKSTRYQKFDINNYHIPKKVRDSKYFEEFKKTAELLFKTYDELFPPMTEYIKKRMPKEEGVSEVAYENSVKAKVCDILRYLLPSGTITAMGFSLNARSAAHAISKLLSYPLEEAKDLGKALLEEGNKICPTLLKYAQFNKYFHQTPLEIKPRAEQTLLEPPTNTEPVSLIHYDPDAEDRIVASILYEQSEQTYEQILEKVKQMNNDKKLDILEAYVKHKGQFDWPLRALENTYFITDILMDYGAFRDVQRHRICTQINQIVTTRHGYDIPNDIIEAGLKDKFVNAMETAKKIHQKMESEMPMEAQYVVPLAYRKRVLVTWNLRELEHVIRLRTTEHGHESYRKIAQKLYEKVVEKFPSFKLLLTVDLNEYYLGRLKSEIKTQRKIEEIKKREVQEGKDLLKTLVEKKD